MLINLLITPGEIQLQLAELFKTARLAQGHSRSKAAKLTGVPDATLRKFENEGQISLRQFLMLCHAYGDLGAADQLFPPRPIHSMDDLLQADSKPRQRGRS
jgi:transcriptional regulator with XRE-family HTH domain